MPATVAIERLSWICAHSGDHHRRSRKGWCARGGVVCVLPPADHTAAACGGASLDAACGAG